MSVAEGRTDLVSNLGFSLLFFAFFVLLYFSVYFSFKFEFVNSVFAVFWPLLNRRIKTNSEELLECSLHQQLRKISGERSYLARIVESTNQMLNSQVPRQTRGIQAFDGGLNLLYASITFSIQA